MRKALSIISVLGALSLAGCGDDSQPAGSGGMGGMGGGGASGAGGAGGMAGSGGGGGTGGAGGIDAPMIDGAVDGSALGPDAAASACMTYCDCMVNGNCQGSANGFADLGPCQTACENLAASQVDCRAQQCNQANDPADMQCQYAVGMGTGIPTACQ